MNTAVASSETNAPAKQRQGLARYWGWIAFVVALILLYGRSLMVLTSEWWTNEDYSHGLLIPFALAYLAYQKRDYLTSIPMHRSIWGLVVIIVSQVEHLVGYLGAEFFLQRTSLVLLLAGMILYVFGWKHLWESAFALLLLVLSIPLPQIIFNQISFPLQLIASSWAEHFLGWMNVPVLREGNILNLANMSLNVAEACSGIRSLMSLITLAVMVAYFLPFRWWVRSLFIATAVPIAIIANAFRVGGTGVLAHRYGAAAAEGFFHTFSGWIIFVVALVILVAEVGILKKLGIGRLQETRA